MKAVKILKPGHAAIVSDAPVPKVRSSEWMLVKVKAVALNPTDWKHVELVTIPATVGCDFSGVVVEDWSGATRSFKKGDRVFSGVHGSNTLDPENGAFAEYLVCKGDVTMKIPDHLGFEEAAANGIGVVTVGQGLYQEMGLPWPDKPLQEKKYILIYGGSAAMGAMGIQFAKLSGFEVITTCSPKNFDYVKSLGADKVFNAYDADVGKQIREYTNNKLYYAWDCIGEHGSPDQCGDALSTSAPPNQTIHYGSILYRMVPSWVTERGIAFHWSIGYTAWGEDWIVPSPDWVSTMGGGELMQPKKPDHLEFMVKWTAFAEKLLMEGKWKPHRQDVREGGLEGVVQGLKDFKEGKISGVKLVYRVD